jgi:hypothetical protein
MRRMELDVEGVTVIQLKALARNLLREAKSEYQRQK